MRTTLLILFVLLATGARAQNVPLLTPGSEYGPPATYTCSYEPVVGYPLCRDSPLAKKLASDCKAADEALDRALARMQGEGSLIFMLTSGQIRDFRTALTARLKLNCSQER